MYSLNVNERYIDLQRPRQQRVNLECATGWQIQSGTQNQTGLVHSTNDSTAQR